MEKYYFRIEKKEKRKHYGGEAKIMLLNEEGKCIQIYKQLT